MHAQTQATLMNTAIGLGFKPPDGKHWTAAMFLPGYKEAAADPGNYDWRKQKELLNVLAKPRGARRDPAEAEAQQDTRNRFRMAQEAKARGASREEIRLIMEA